MPKVDRCERLTHAEELPLVRGEHAFRNGLLERGDGEFEQVPESVGGPGVEQQAPPGPRGARSRMEQGAVQRRLEDDGVACEGRVGETADPAFGEEVCQDSRVQDRDVIQGVRFLRECLCRRGRVQERLVSPG